MAESKIKSAERSSLEVFSILKETGNAWMDDKAMRLSASLALYAILSLAPFLVITIKVVGLLWRDEHDARSHVMHQLTTLMGAQAAKGLEPMLNSSAKIGSGLIATILSTAVLLFSATGVFVELQNSMNTIWHVEPKPGSGVRSFFVDRLLSLAMVFGIAFLLLVSMFVSTLLAAFAQWIAGDVKWLLHGVDLIVSFFVVSLLFAAIFKFLPDVEVQWGDVWRAALMTGALFTIGKYGLALYFKYGTPTSAFGAAGSLVAVLLWVYYSSFILFFGAEYTKVWAERAREPAGSAERRRAFKSTTGAIGDR